MIETVAAVNLGLGDWEEDLVVGHRGIAVVAFEVGLILEIGIHRGRNIAPAAEVEPALTFHSEFQTTLHADGTACIILVPTGRRVLLDIVVSLVDIEIDGQIGASLLDGADGLATNLVDEVASLVEVLT